MSATVNVVELALGDRVVDVDGGKEEFAAALHLVEPLNACRRFFGHAVTTGRNTVPALVVPVEVGLKQVEDDAVFFGIGFGVERRNLVGLFELETLVDQERGVATVVDNHVRARAVGEAERHVGAPPVFGKRFALPRIHRDALRVVRGAGRTDCDCCGRAVLSRKDVARHPAHVSAEVDQGFDQHGGLHRHVKAAHDLHTVERLLAGEAVAQGHQAGHFNFGESDFFAAQFGEGKICDLERQVVLIGGHVLSPG